MRAVKIGIVGLGTVGGGFYNMAKNRKEFQITKLLNRTEEKYAAYNVPTEMIANDLYDLIEGVDIVVETVGGIDFPNELISRALTNGKDVVTANKALIADRGDKLLELAKEKGRKLLFGASVGGGMPVLQNIQYHSLGKITRVYGILNATSNFVISKMSKGLNMSEAIKTAQEEGYAEQDPSDDISGMDAARKLMIICAYITGKLPSLENVSINPLQINREQMSHVEKAKMVVKPIVYMNIKDGEIELWVGPAAVAHNSKIAKVDGTENCLIVEGESGINSLTGMGAGRNPTAFAVMADVISIVKGNALLPCFKKDKDLNVSEPNFKEIKGVKILDI